MIYLFMTTNVRRFMRSVSIWEFLISKKLTYHNVLVVNKKTTDKIDGFQCM